MTFFVIISDEINLNYKWLLTSSKRFSKYQKKCFFKYKIDFKIIFSKLLFSSKPYYCKISVSIPLIPLCPVVGTIGATHVVWDLHMEVSLILFDVLFALKQMN